MESEHPYGLFAAWHADAMKRSVPEPSWVALATASKDGAPSVRIVLLKAHDARGFVFFTNSLSRKGAELAENPRAALCFYWDDLGRQVRVEGRAETVAAEESDRYFASRRRASQLGAWASLQSRPMPDADALRRRVETYEREFEGRPVPRPGHWNGYRLAPDAMEFWSEREFRLHERVRYRKAEGGEWEKEMLFP
jgi:pyridoxamine 5'-phosphate oxidase